VAVQVPPQVWTQAPQIRIIRQFTFVDGLRAGDTRTQVYFFPLSRKSTMAAAMPQMAIPPAASRLLLSGNEAVARAVWESGVRVAAAYPGTPSTEMLEVVSGYPDIYAEWSVNEKVSLEVAIGAAFAGSRSFCCMKHVGMNVASDALMTLTLTGVVGGLVIAVADDVGLSSSQNEQDSRYWGRFAHSADVRALGLAGSLRDDQGRL
jgi:hypothetical protein